MTKKQVINEKIMTKEVIDKNNHLYSEEVEKNIKNNLLYRMIMLFD